MASALEGANSSHFHHHRKFSWTVLVQRLSTPTTSQPRAQVAHLRYFPTLSVLLLSSAALPVTPQPACPGCQPPPNTRPTPACYLLAHPGVAHRLAPTDNLPSPRSPSPGRQEGVAGVPGLAPAQLDWAGSVLACGVCVIHQEKVVVWRKLGSCWRLSCWTS